MMMYLYETSRNIQEPWPPDLYFMVHWLRTLARLSRLRFLSMIDPQDLLMVASWYFMWKCISETSRNIQEPWPPVLYFTVCWPDFGQFSMVNIFVIGRFLSSTDGSKLIFMSSTEGEGDILFLVRNLLASASALAWHFLFCTISHEPVGGF